MGVKYWDGPSVCLSGLWACDPRRRVSSICLSVVSETKHQGWFLSPSEFLCRLEQLPGRLPCGCGSESLLEERSRVWAFILPNNAIRPQTTFLPHKLGQWFLVLRHDHGLESRDPRMRSHHTGMELEERQSVDSLVLFAPSSHAASFLDMTTSMVCFISPGRGSDSHTHSTDSVC